MKAFFKWAGIITSGLAILIVAAILALNRMGEERLMRVYKVREETITLPTDAASLVEGQRIFRFRGCEACHGEHLEGKVYLDNPAIGQVITPNLTPGRGGIGNQRTDVDWVRSIRHGLRPDGTPLLFMPSTEFYFLSDEDLGRVIAYIKSVPAVDQETLPSKLSLTGRIVMTVTKAITFLPAELIPHDAPRPQAPQPGVTPAYGEYLTYSCKVCHGLTLSGGEIPGFPPEWPPAPNLTFGKGSSLPYWSEEAFIQIIRTGNKHTRSIDPAYMPWQSYRYMTDDELRAVYAYLKSLPPKDYGHR